MRSPRLRAIESKEAAKLQHLAPGDVTWVNLGRSFWWPAQVADEESVSEKCKPHKRLRNGTLVRLYGTYQFLFVDAMKSSLAFENALKEKKKDAMTMFQEALKAISERCGNQNIKAITSDVGSEETPIKGDQKNSKARKHKTGKLQEADLEADADDSSKDKEAIKATEKTRSPRSKRARGAIKGKERKQTEKVLDKRQVSFEQEKAIETEAIKNESPISKTRNIVRLRKCNPSSELTDKPMNGASKKSRTGQSNGECRKSGRINSSANYKETEILNEETPKQANGRKQMTKNMQSVSPIVNKKRNNGITGHLQDCTKRNSEGSPNSAERKTLVTSERRIRMMQNLGLIAPPGSPFKK